MANRYDYGILEDFNNMTSELATTITVYPRDVEANYEGQEDEQSNNGTGVSESASIVELDEKHEMVTSGQMNVGDLVVTFLADSTVEPESRIVWGGRTYKILSMKKPKGLQNDIVTYVVGYGKRVPNR